MKSVMEYQCDVCGERYFSENECIKCEKSHIQDLKITCMRFQGYRQSDTDFPWLIYLADNKGRSQVYRRVDKI